MLAALGTVPGQPGAMNVAAAMQMQQVAPFFPLRMVSIAFSVEMLRSNPYNYHVCLQMNRGGAGGADSIEERLVKLNNLKDKGLVTDAEYAKRREEILNDV
eukprot:CAMPEP_0118888658 /NCGR_PEP_ID=MMETSP1163-20130328/25713_1 /TAXON_ID=124430 /ORGANISM="Phaeomonas parva, Strain CCMP2877" /LENGTH=100 /DNA_ID=CAMNT_0006827229 /DNA_START=9 /DNA_END=312 /DNA_ORIENTATION=+